MGKQLSYFSSYSPNIKGVNTLASFPRLLTSVPVVARSRGQSPVAVPTRLCSVTGRQQGETSVHVAAGVGQLEVVQALRSQGAGLDRVDERGDTAVTWAARHGHPTVLSYLIAQGASIDWKNKVRRAGRADYFDDGWDLKN